MAMQLERLFTDSILQYMKEGVLVLNSEGEIIGINEAAASILVIDMADGPVTFADVHSGRACNDDFVQVLLDSVYEGTVIHDRLVEYIRPDGSGVPLVVTASLLRNESGKVEGAFLVLGDATEMEEIKASECLLNEELKSALRQTEEHKRALEGALQRGQKIRSWLTVIVFMLFLGLGSIHWFRSFSQYTPGQPAALSGDARGAQASMVVTPRAVTRTISLSGVVAPLEEVILAAPFQGQVQSKAFFYGDSVEREQSLLVLDTSEIMAKVREARAEYIKAKKKSLELEEWEKTPDVSKAKRSLEQAKIQLEKAKSKASEDKMLYERGVLPRSEYETSLQDVRDMKMQHLSSYESLQSTLEKGDHDYLEIARMELQNAEEKLKAAEEKLAQAELSAPVAGIAIRPASREKDAKNVVAGMSVAEGQALLSIGSLEGLSITAEVDELDINSLKKGQAVLVSGDAFPGIRLKGRISQISSQANEGQVPTFTTTIRLRDLPDDLGEKVRLGMTANLQVETYSNPEALLVPLSAVRRSGQDGIVSVVEADGSVREVTVKTGGTTMAEVEILFGLNPGATILLGP